MTAETLPFVIFEFKYQNTVIAKHRGRCKDAALRWFADNYPEYVDDMCEGKVQLTHRPPRY